MLFETGSLRSMKDFVEYELNTISNFHCALFKTSVINYKNSS